MWTPTTTARMRVRDRARDTRRRTTPHLRSVRARPTRRRDTAGQGPGAVHRPTDRGGHGGRSVCDRLRPGPSSGSSSAPGRGEVGIRVLIVDDHRLFAEAIRVTVTEMGMSVLGVVHHRRRGAGRCTLSIGPTWCWWISGLPDRIGSGARQARSWRSCPARRSSPLTALEDERSVQDAFEAGFHGYLTKQTEARAIQAGSEERRRWSDGVPAPARPESRTDGGAGMELLAEQLTRERSRCCSSSRRAPRVPRSPTARGLTEHRPHARAGDPVEAPSPFATRGRRVRCAARPGETRARSSRPSQPTACRTDVLRPTSAQRSCAHAFIAPIRSRLRRVERKAWPKGTE